MTGTRSEARTPIADRRSPGTAIARKNKKTKNKPHPNLDRRLGGICFARLEAASAVEAGVGYPPPVTAKTAQRILIRGGRPLRGRVTVSGSKNASLYALAAGLGLWVGAPEEGVIVLPVAELRDRYDKLPPPARSALA